MSACLRPVAAPFVAAAPGGVRVRARLRVSLDDGAVLWAAGTYLGSLAGRDLAARCAEGRLDARRRAASRAVRKRALTAESSSRWAGAITRTSEDQWRLAEQNLRAGKSSLTACIGRIEARLAVPAGGRVGRIRGYATAAERHAKSIRLQSLKARLARIERQLEAGAVSVVRGGRALLRKRDSPTGRLRDRLTQMASNAGLSVIVIDPAYTSRWGAEHWLRPLREHHSKATGHHAAALVIGRRGLGHRARRRATGNQTAPEEAGWPAQARPRTTRRERPHPGNPPPHETPGSHPAPRPDGLTGARQATRQPKTVRGRRLDMTTSC